MSQKIPKGYSVLRAKGVELFTFARDDRHVASAAYPSKREAIDAIWQDFRSRATAGAAAVGLALALTGCLHIPSASSRACDDGDSSQVCEAHSDRSVL